VSGHGARGTQLNILLKVVLEAYEMSRKNSVRACVMMAIMALAGTAMADCVLNGVVYPEGAVIGNMICSNGQWVPRQ
jgi:hypothetical protein